MSNKRVLTDNQKAFLEALFGEAKGDPVKAIKLAGYAESTKTSEVVNALKDEILEAATNILAMNAPRAALEMVGILTDPNQAGATNKMKAIESILDRTGVKSKESSDVNLKVPQGGLFIMPAKGAKPDEEEKVQELQED